MNIIPAKAKETDMIVFTELISILRLFAVASGSLSAEQNIFPLASVQVSS